MTKVSIHSAMDNYQQEPLIIDDNYNNIIPKKEINSIKTNRVLTATNQHQRLRQVTSKFLQRVTCKNEEDVVTGEDTERLNRLK